MHSTGSDSSFLVGRTDRGILPVEALVAYYASLEELRIAACIKPNGPLQT